MILNSANDFPTLWMKPNQAVRLAGIEHCQQLPIASGVNERIRVPYEFPTLSNNGK